MTPGSGAKKTFDDEEMKAEAKRTIKLLLAKITRKALGPITPVALDYDI